jgi:phosphate-selective porin OprO/OprP
VSGARKIFPALSRRGHRVDRIYNYWPRGDSYAGINSSFETRDGLRWELQIHTPDSYDATREGRSLYERMRRTDVSPEERGAIFEQLVDLWDLVPIPKGALAQGAVHPRDRLVVRDEFGQIGSAAQEAKSEAWALRWRNGVWMESADGAHRLHVGGRVLLDAGVVDESAGLVNATFQGTSSGVKFRQARVLVEGQLFRHLAFKVNYEFAGGEVGFADVFAAVVNAGPTDAIRVGHMKVPFSFEQAMSRKYMTFMERSLANALAPDVRETGFEAYGTLMSGRLRWDAGAFRNTDAAGDGFGSDNGYDLALRVSGLPIRSNGNRRLLHLGLSYVHQFRDGSGEAFSTQPESFLADTLLNTGMIAITGVDILGLELVAVAGSFSLEAEYLHDFVQRSYQPSVQFHGGYVQVAYYLTGESRSYTLTSGVFDRIVPNRNVALGAPGWGAWQVAARFSRLDLDDRDVSGGTETNGTFAINWYPSPITRLSTEYVYGKVDRQGDVHVWQIRFQFEF